MDILPVSTALASLPVASPLPAPAARADIERLRELTQPTSTVVAPADMASAPTMNSEAPATLGDRILDVLDKTSQGLKEKWQRVDQAINRETEPTTQDILRAQAELVDLAVQYQVIGKVVTRAAKNVEDLLKVQ